MAQQTDQIRLDGKIYTLPVEGRRVPPPRTERQRNELPRRPYEAQEVPTQIADPRQPFELAMGTFEGGSGHSFAQSGTFYETARGLIPYGSRELRTWGPIGSGAIPMAAGTAWLFTAEGWVYVFNGRFVYKLSLATLQAGYAPRVLSTFTWPNNRTVRGRPVLYDGSIVVPLSEADGAPARFAYVTPSSASGAEVWQYGTIRATSLHVWNKPHTGYALAAGVAGGVRVSPARWTDVDHENDASGPQTDTGWGALARIGDGEVNAVASLGRFLVVASPSGLYHLDETLVSVRVQLGVEDVDDRLAGVGMQEAWGWLYFPHTQGLARWRPATVEYVGPEPTGSLDPDLAPGLGRVRAVGVAGPDVWLLGADEHPRWTLTMLANGRLTRMLDHGAGWAEDMLMCSQPAEFGRVNTGPGSTEAHAARITGTSGSGRTPVSSGTSIYAWHFGISLPQGATVRGIEVEIVLAHVGTIADNRVELIAGGVGTGANRAYTVVNGVSSIPENVSRTRHGGPTDTWGHDWTPADFEDRGEHPGTGDPIGFGVEMNYTLGGDDPQLYVTDVIARVYATVSGVAGRRGTAIVLTSSTSRQNMVLRTYLLPKAALPPGAGGGPERRQENVEWLSPRVTAPSAAVDKIWTEAELHIEFGDPEVHAPSAAPFTPELAVKVEDEHWRAFALSAVPPPANTREPADRGRFRYIAPAALPAGGWAQVRLRWGAGARHATIRGLALRGWYRPETTTQWRLSLLLQGDSAASGSRRTVRAQRQDLETLAGAAGRPVSFRDPWGAEHRVIVQSVSFRDVRVQSPEDRAMLTADVALRRLPE